MATHIGDVTFTRLDLNDNSAGDMGVYYPVFSETVEYLEPIFEKLMKEGNVRFFLPKRAQLARIEICELDEEMCIDVCIMGIGGMAALIGAVIFLAAGWGWRATYLQDGLWRDRALLWFRSQER